MKAGSMLDTTTKLEEPDTIVLPSDPPHISGPLRCLTNEASMQYRILNMEWLAGALIRMMSEMEQVYAG